jgi:hypothetical protein
MEPRGYGNLSYCVEREGMGTCWVIMGQVGLVPFHDLPQILILSPLPAYHLGVTAARIAADDYTMRKPIDAPLYAQLCIHYGVKDPGDLPARIVRDGLSPVRVSGIDGTRGRIARTRRFARRDRRWKQTKTSHRYVLGSRTGKHRSQRRFIDIARRFGSPRRQLVHQHISRRYPRCHYRSQASDISRR